MTKIGPKNVNLINHAGNGMFTTPLVDNIATPTEIANTMEHIQKMRLFFLPKVGCFILLKPPMIMEFYQQLIRLVYCQSTYSSDTLRSVC
jgi:hypothetical protein